MLTGLESRFMGREERLLTTKVLSQPGKVRKLLMDAMDDIWKRPGSQKMSGIQRDLNNLVKKVMQVSKVGVRQTNSEKKTRRVVLDSVSGKNILKERNVVEATVDQVTIDSEWLKEVVGGLGGGSTMSWEVEGWKEYLVEEFGKLTGRHVARDHPALKLLLMEGLLRRLSEEPCKDPRIVRPVPVIVTPVFMEDEEAGMGHFLRKGRRFYVNDPLAFNKAFRELQASHPFYPRTFKVPVPHGTKGMTQPLSAIGIGPRHTSPWGVVMEGLRGPVDTDPDTEVVLGKWKKCKGGDRDGLYCTEYGHCYDRAIKHAKYVFNM
jgi:hypothetical protein